MLTQLRGAAPWIVGLAAAMVAGAAVVVSPLFLAVEVLLLIVLAALLYPNSRWQLAPMTVLVVSPAIFLDAAGEPLPNGDAVQKALLILALGCLVFSAGVRWSGVGAAAIAAIGLASVVSILNIGGAIDVGTALAGRAVIGYSLPWTFLFIDWRKVGISRGLGFLVKLPLFSVIAGIPLQVAGVSTVFNVEATGVPRLQGASIPAHLAFLALIGLVAGLCLLGLPRIDGNPRTYLWVGLNLVILTATATRGGIAVGVGLVVVFIVHALLVSRSVSSRARKGAWVVSSIGMAAMFLAAPELIRRSIGNSYEGTFNTSGRDQAWDFFFGLASQSPLTGKGLGFASIAVQMYAPPHVQKLFFAPHNEYIHLLLDGGVFFLVALMAAMLVLFTLAARAQRGTVRWVISLFGVGFMAYSFTDNTFSTPQFTVLLVMLLGILLANPAPRRRRAAEAPVAEPAEAVGVP
ncbi:O-antigen ligase family protein [Mycolicibacterium sp.]|uniref:O-antigen ligase family protein n=1 Tax=Mycolicibacterium sp. TaxID=2320850 RepID=UPI001A18FC17|nr:O-antigen ligase family protein [Mycolicibacterium sp.]MBJ7338661.1 O-antigen ligase family protein [Mycolicibacterium sp.]